MAFKLKGSAFNRNTGIGGVQAEKDLKSEMGSDQELGGRWKGMTLSELDANIREERESIGNDPKTLKAFNKRQAKLRNQAINAA
tara:strand:- start:187 stop:438 length:252 start_codon:yes stop_codon:yes gene_type:complete